MCNKVKSLQKEINCNSQTDETLQFVESIRLADYEEAVEKPDGYVKKVWEVDDEECNERKVEL